MELYVTEMCAYDLKKKKKTFDLAHYIFLFIISVYLNNNDS